VLVTVDRGADRARRRGAATWPSPGLIEPKAWPGMSRQLSRGDVTRV